MDMLQVTKLQRLIMKLMLHLVLLSPVPRSSAQSDYCGISPQHTLCQYKVAGQFCRGGVLDRGVSKEEIRRIVETHNNYRARIAQGKETKGRPGPQIGAKNMRELVWDPELAAVAQMHANQCQFEHDCSDCRRVSRFGVGQNLYIYKQSVRRAAVDWVRAVESWYEEVEMFSRKNVYPFKFSHETGHYTQLAWADTDKIGCGATAFKEGRWFSTLYTCNYGPGGNFIRGEMYSQGQACSGCPTGTSCSARHPGLCRETSFPPANTSTVWKKTIKTTRSPQISKPKRKQSVKSSAVSSTLLSCDFETDSENCKIRSSGPSWVKTRSHANSFYSVSLTEGNKTELFFSHLLGQPAGRTACMQFRYRKYNTDGVERALQVISWPYQGNPATVSVVQDSSDRSTWTRAQIVFRNLDKNFLLMFRASGPSTGRGSMNIAVDDVQVVQGRCSKGKRRRRRSGRLLTRRRRSKL